MASSPFQMFDLLSRQVRRGIKAQQSPLTMSHSSKSLKQLAKGPNENLLKEFYKVLPGVSEILQQLVVAETDWNLSGRNILFPGSEDFYSRLLTSRFMIPEGENAQLNFPSAAFILALPRDMTVNGYKIPSPMVTYSNTRDERIEQYRRVERVLKSGISEEEFLRHETMYSCVSIFFHNPQDESDTTTTKLTLNLSQLADVLKIDMDAPDCLRHFEQIAARQKDSSALAMDMSHSDLYIQMILMRLIVGLSVYISAAGESVLSDGIPKVTGIPTPGLDKHSKPTMRRIPAPSQTRNASTMDTPTTRRWHFRNLRADRYYQGDYASWPKGSRWTIVSEAQVGKYKATTVHDEETD